MDPADQCSAKPLCEEISVLLEFLLTQGAEGCRKELRNLQVSFLHTEIPASSVVVCKEIAKYLLHVLERWRAV